MDTEQHVALDEWIKCNTGASEQAAYLRLRLATSLVSNDESWLPTFLSLPGFPWQPAPLVIDRFRARVGPPREGDRARLVEVAAGMPEAIRRTCEELLRP